MEHNADTPSDSPYWMATPGKPGLKLPPGACDAHVHVFGPRQRFPFAEGRSYTPSDAPKELLFRLHERLGIQHCVIVQPACHGTDNSVTVDAIAATGGSYKGVALVPLTASDTELRRLNAAGLCGARFHYMTHLARGPGIDEVISFGRRLADIGWHLQIHMEAALIADLAPALKRSPVPVVIDHMGRSDARAGTATPGFESLLRFVGAGGCWVKLSGAHRISRAAPDYPDAKSFHEALVAENPDRLVWGGDWPHPRMEEEMPDVGHLLDLFTGWTPDAAIRRRILVTNPQRLYGFPAA